jgi:hypothetical protein
LDYLLIAIAMKRIQQIVLLTVISLTVILISCKKNVEAKKPPAAVAGNEKMVILPVNSTELKGVGYDGDGVIVNYDWHYLSGPVSYTIVNPSEPHTKLKDLERGIYEFELKVTDNDGFFATDKTTVYVFDSLQDPLNVWGLGRWDY